MTRAAEQIAYWRADGFTATQALGALGLVTSWARSWLYVERYAETALCRVEFDHNDVFDSARMAAEEYLWPPSARRIPSKGQERWRKSA